MTSTRPLRADAERSTARILEAAETVFADEPNASLERVADVAGLARTTVHRRFANRAALLETLVEQLNARYLQALEDARVGVDDPVVALHRLAQRVFELKVGNRFAIGLAGAPNADVVTALEAFCTRLHGARAITASDPAWCRGVCLALLEEVHRLPAGSPSLQGGDEVLARKELFVRTLLAALGGRP